MKPENKNKELRSAQDIRSGRVSWRSPSNIALIKYWGKYGHQLPRNPSLSITLSHAFSETSISYYVKEKESEDVNVEFYFEGKSNPKFENRIRQFLLKNETDIPFIKDLQLVVHSKNSFPHSSGIASSASSMSALALCLVSIMEHVQGDKMPAVQFFEKVSDLSRKASGSASRSVCPKMGLWGKTELYSHSSDLYAVPYDNFHSAFDGMHDDILIVSPFEKKVSSSEGHRLMDNNRYARERYSQANDNLKKLIRTLKEGDMPGFGKIIEDEALVLHALMMCSEPSFILMEANTLHIINEIRNFRQSSGTPMYFTLDAGPNVHVLYPGNAKNKAKEFIAGVLKKYCYNGMILEDKMGNGPALMFNEINSKT